VIIVSSLANDFLPTSWDEFIPTWVDIATMLGAFGLFGVLFLLFCRYLPMIAIAEVKSVMPEANPHWEGYAHHGGAHHGHGGAPAGSQPAFQDPRPGQP